MITYLLDNNLYMNKCPRCGENNPAEVHTCTPLTEHEKLKEICNIINFNITNSELDIHHSSLLSYFHKEPMFCRYYNGERNKINVREIIFTQEFMEKLYSYFYSLEGDDNMRGIIKDGLMVSLDKPASYLYNLIKE